MDNRIEKRRIMYETCKKTIDEYLRANNKVINAADALYAVECFYAEISKGFYHSVMEGTVTDGEKEANAAILLATKILHDVVNSAGIDCCVLKADPDTEDEYIRMLSKNEVDELNIFRSDEEEKSDAEK